MPRGYVTFRRFCITEIPNWKESKKSLCKLEIRVNGTIEDSDGYGQVDFANKMIGGGVIGRVRNKKKFDFYTREKGMCTRRN